MNFGDLCLSKQKGYSSQVCETEAQVRAEQNRWFCGSLSLTAPVPSASKPVELRIIINLLQSPGDVRLDGHPAWNSGSKTVRANSLQILNRSGNSTKN
jgi:hypothetical protein